MKEKMKEKLTRDRDEQRRNNFFFARMFENPQTRQMN